MVDEARKALVRRINDNRFKDRYFIGKGIDIGAGNDGLHLQAEHWSNIKDCYPWDLKDGDAMLMESVADETYDFVHSAHCLEHLVHPTEALRNWIRITKPGGHLVILVPDEDLYEQGVWPSTFNDDHKWTFTINKGWIHNHPIGDHFSRIKERRNLSWSDASINVFEMLHIYSNKVSVLKVELLDATFNYNIPRVDQTLGRSESAIEIILRKKTTEEIENLGRLPTPHYITFQT